MTDETRKSIENFINIRYKAYIENMYAERDFAERCKGEVIGAMHVLNEFGYYCDREGDNYDWRIVGD